MRWLVFFCLLMNSFVVHAKVFEARINDTQWVLATSALDCRLTHPIPDYGEARFEKDNAGELQLVFASHNYPAADDQLSFAIMRAPWHSSQHYHTELATLPVEPGQTTFTLRGRHASQAMTALKAGEFAFIRYQSQTLNTLVEARISTVSANRSLNFFTQCLNDLHPQSFADLQHQRVYFDSESAELSSKAREKLDQLADYLSIDDEIQTINIRSHTDSFGKRKLNDPLSDERATVIKDYLTQRQVSADVITTVSLMATEPAASNKTAEGRAQNRRAEIILKR